MKTVYITTIVWNSLEDYREEDELLHYSLDAALVHLAEEGFTKMRLTNPKNTNAFVSFDQEGTDAHSAYIEVNTGNWMTAKEQAEYEKKLKDEGQ